MRGARRVARDQLFGLAGRTGVGFGWRRAAGRRCLARLRDARCEPDEREQQ